MKHGYYQHMTRTAGSMTHKSYNGAVFIYDVSALFFLASGYATEDASISLCYYIE